MTVSVSGEAAEVADDVEEAVRDQLGVHSREWRVPAAGTVAVIYGAEDVDWRAFTDAVENHRHASRRDVDLRAETRGSGVYVARIDVERRR